MKNETPFEEFAWYINFQAAVLKQLPRPDEIDQATALGWERNQKALKKNLAEVLLPPKKWIEKDGVVYFSVTSDGTTSKEWITRLGKKGCHLSDYAKQLLLSEDFKPTKGITTEVAVLKAVLFKDSNRITKNIRKNAEDSKFETPNIEITCLIREKFTNEEIKAMGLDCIVTMHEPIKDSDGRLILLGIDRDGYRKWISAYSGNPEAGWRRKKYGFAFTVS